MVRWLTCALLVFAAAAPVAALADVHGQWAVTFASVTGPKEFVMVITQNGTRLSGHLTSDIGEFPLKGTVEDDQVTIVWSLVEEGKAVEITFKGKADGERISGTARLGEVGEGPLYAERTDKNP
jgi:hypothetical protein